MALLYKINLISQLSYRILSIFIWLLYRIMLLVIAYFWYWYDKTIVSPLLSYKFKSSHWISYSSCVYFIPFFFLSQRSHWTSSFMGILGLFFVWIMSHHIYQVVAFSFKFLHVFLFSFRLLFYFDFSNSFLSFGMLIANFSELVHFDY